MNALSASYDEEDNRVVLEVVSDPRIESVSILRQLPDGTLHPIVSLRQAYVAESGHTTLYDYTAPLNTGCVYQCVYHRGTQLAVDSTCTAAVTTTTHWNWLKNPLGWCE